MNILNPYLKFVVAVLGAAAAAMQTEWPSARWSAVVTAFITAILVYFVPNIPSPPKGPGTT